MQHPNPYTILAVSANLESLTATLQTARYDLLSATNIEAALKLTQSQKPDLVICDLVVHPSIDCAVLRHQIRSNHEIAQTPILVINKLHLPTGATALDNQDSLHEDFLEVPYEPIELFTRITRLIERKRIHDELNDSKNRYINLFENAADIVYTHDLNGRYTSLNKKGREMTGYSLDEITSIDFQTLANPEDVKLAKEMLRRKLEDHETSTVYEISILTKDRSLIPVEVSTQLIFENSKVIGVHGIARDIRARKQAEQQLLDAERRANTEYKILLGRIAKLSGVLSSARELKQIFSALLEFSKISLPCDSLGIALYNHEHVELTPHFLWAENKVVDLTNFKPIPITSNSDIRNAILSAKTMISTTNNPKHPIPVTFGYAETDIKPASTMIVPMSIMGRTIGILEIQSIEPDAYQNQHTTAIEMAATLAANTIENVRLLAGERQHEDQLRQSQKMEAIGHLASGLAHDLNNIITAIYSYCDLGLREVAEDHLLHKLLEDIRACGKRAALQTKQLLGLSVNRKQITQPVNLNLNTLIKDLQGFIRRTITEDISITWKFTEGLPDIKADKGQIEHVLINLIINARDAMPQGGRITITTSLVYPEQRSGQKNAARPTAPQIQLTLADTGIGMSTEVQQQIFEPFFTTKETGKGTGLGLSTAYGSVKQAGGSIWVESEENHGTTFIIRFPVAREHLSQLQETRPPSLTLVDQPKQTILVAEDDPTVREAIRAALTYVGFEILEATNGIDAFEIFQEHRDNIHLLLTDVLMPEMNGRQLAQRIQKQRPDMPVIYISGHSTDSIAERGALLEGLNFLEKPFEEVDLIHKVQHTLAIRHSSAA